MVQSELRYLHYVCISSAVTILAEMEIWFCHFASQTPELSILTNHIIYFQVTFSFSWPSFLLKLSNARALVRTASKTARTSCMQNVTLRFYSSFHHYYSCPGHRPWARVIIPSHWVTRHALAILELIFILVGAAWKQKWPKKKFSPRVFTSSTRLKRQIISRRG